MRMPPVIPVTGGVFYYGEQMSYITIYEELEKVVFTIRRIQGRVLALKKLEEEAKELNNISNRIEDICIKSQFHVVKSPKKK